MSVGHRIYWLSKVMQMSAFTIFKMLLTFDSERNMVLIIEIILAKKHCTVTVLQFHAVKNQLLIMLLVAKYTSTIILSFVNSYSISQVHI